MLPIDLRKIRDEKIIQLKNGYNAFVEKGELVRLMERAIEKEKLHVECDKTDAGYWFTLAPTSETS